MILFAFFFLSALSVGLIATSLITFRYVVQNKDKLVFDLSAEVLELEKLGLLAERKNTLSAGFLLTGDPSYRTQVREVRQTFLASLLALQEKAQNPNTARLLKNIAMAENDHYQALERLAGQVQENPGSLATRLAYEETMRPRREKLARAFSKAIEDEQAQLAHGMQLSNQAESWGTRMLLAGALLTLIFTALFGTLGLRTTRRLQRVESDIRENEVYFRDLTDHSPAMIWVTNENGFCSYINRTWLEFTGKPLKEQVGFGWLNSVHRDDAQDTYDAFLSATRCKADFSRVYRLRHRGGDFRWVLARGTPRFDAQGKFLGYVGALAEIDQQKQAEKRLESALNSRDEFISIASHELKTPLTSLKLFLQMTKRTNARTQRALSPQELAGFCDSSLKQVCTLERLVEDLLVVSRLRSGHLAVSPEHVRLADLVHTVANRFLEQSAHSGNEIELNLDENLEGDWDPYRVQQILSNLLANAIRHAPGCTITVSALRQADRAVIEVSDRGPGIPSEKLPQVFERYERVNPERSSAGLGLGLFITRGLVQAHQGDIRVESTQGHGAKFIVDLPLHARSNSRALSREVAIA